MSDQHGTPMEEAPVPSPSVAPVPVPLGVPVKKRSKWALVIVAAVLLLLGGACAGAVYLANQLYSGVADTDYGPWASPSFFWEGSGGVAWSGGARYGVVQYFGDGGVPGVAVWDRETGEIETLVGYMVVAVEREGAQVWLEPTEEVDYVYDGLNDVVDHHPAELLVWRLDESTGPTADAPAKWRAWPGPGDYTAYLEVDPLKGCMPARLLINNNESSGEGVRAALPDTTNTFACVGWSPSGDYFAVEELIDADAFGMLASDAGTGSISEEDPPARKLLVFSAESGDLVAQAELPAGPTTAPIALWGASDVLYWADADAAMMGGADVAEGDMSPVPVEMYSLAPGGGAEAYATPDDIFKSSWSVISLGSDENGALFCDSIGSIWRIGTGGVEHSGSLMGADYATWDPRGGLLVARAEYTDVDDTGSIIAMHLVLFDEHGAGQRTLWTGPEVRQELDTAF